MKLTVKDYLIMLGLMLVFGLIVFFRLGNDYAPETYMELSGDRKEIILNFGDYVSVSKLKVYLRLPQKRKVSVSTFNEVTGKWQIINDSVELSSVFTWNEIAIGWHLKYIGIVFLDDYSSINEIACYNGDNKLIIPENASDYPELFDEQDKIPDYYTYMSGTMYDEVYHGRTAYEFNEGLVHYETTHPHLGKSIISLGIRMFGMNPFGWRFMSAVFGILSMAIIYLFAKVIFESTFIAAMTDTLLLFETMHLNLSRIATIDIFVADFILLMYLFMFIYCKNDTLARKKAAENNEIYSFNIKSLIPLGLSGLSMALAVSTKWVGVYAAVGLALIFVVHTLKNYPKGQVLKLFLFCVAFFVVIPVIIYALSFIPAVTTKKFDNIFEKAFELSGNMLKYHLSVGNEHPYATRFYEWPIVWRPLWDSIGYVQDGLISVVNCFGNPYICFAGIPAVLFLAFRSIFKKDGIAGFLIIGYLSQYLPWFFVSRTTYIYHYFPSILFIILILGYVLKLIADKWKKGYLFVIGFVVLAGAVFVIYFPVVTGLPITREHGEALRLFSSWKLC